VADGVVRPEELLAEAAHHGARVEAAGDRLVLTAPAAPPPGLVERLRAAKPALMAHLIAAGAAADARAWRGLYAERAADLVQRHRVPPPRAARLAHEAAVACWLNANPPRQPDPGRCAACGVAMREHDAIPVLTGTGGHVWLHPRCYPAWWRERRGAARAALRAMGIPEPADDLDLRIGHIEEQEGTDA
jgi:hypothetical protein